MPLVCFGGSNRSETWGETSFIHKYELVRWKMSLLILVLLSLRWFYYADTLCNNMMMWHCAAASWSVWISKVAVWHCPPLFFFLKKMCWYGTTGVRKGLKCGNNNTMIPRVKIQQAFVLKGDHVLISVHKEAKAVFVLDSGWLSWYITHTCRLYCFFFNHCMQCSSKYDF